MSRGLLLIVLLLFMSCSRLSVDKTEVSTSGAVGIIPADPSGVFLFAGAIGGSGNLDGTDSGARLSSPRGAATDSLCNIYISDSGNNTTRKVIPAGVVSTFAGTAGIAGASDGTGAAASFKYPYGLAVDSSGNVYVADTGNHAIRKISPAGVVTTLAGGGFNGWNDGTGPAAYFSYPYGLAVDSSGYVYVADTLNHVIRKITPAGVVTTFAGIAASAGSEDGAVGVARLSGPRGVTVDSSGNVYVTDTSSTIRKITPAGVVSTLAGTAGSTGSSDGSGATASFNSPSGIAVDSVGNVYVADSGNHMIRKTTSAGVVSTLAGTAGSAGAIDANGSEARFNGPYGIALDSSGNLYVADENSHIFRKITPTGVVNTLVGLAGAPGSIDSTAATARLNYPHGVAVDSSGSVLVADASSHHPENQPSRGS